MKFDGATARLVDDTIGYRDVFRLAPTKAKDRPARAESAIRHRDEFAAAEQRAGVVLANHRAVADRYVLAADEMKPVIVLDNTIENADAIELRVFTLNNPKRMKSARKQINVAHGDVRALIKHQVI